jgi:hypothetical protein
MRGEKKRDKRINNRRMGRVLKPDLIIDVVLVKNKKILNGFFTGSARSPPVMTSPIFS